MAKTKITNAILLEAIRESKEQNQITDELAQHLIYLAERMVKRASWRGMVYPDDIVAESLAQLSKLILKFDESKSQNPFAYITSIITSTAHYVIAKDRIYDQMRYQDYCDSMFLEYGGRVPHNKLE